MSYMSHMELKSDFFCWYIKTENPNINKKNNERKFLKNMRKNVIF